MRVDDVLIRALLVSFIGVQRSKLLSHEVLNLLALKVVQDHILLKC